MYILNGNFFFNVHYHIIIFEKHFIASYKILYATIEDTSENVILLCCFSLVYAQLFSSQ